MQKIVIQILLLLCFVYPLSAARKALVIGNGAYNEGALKNPASDAELISGTLRTMNFDVTTKIDLDAAEFERAIQTFAQNINLGDEIFFYYSGHAIQIAGENYLLPVNENITDEITARHKSLKLNMLLDYLNRSKINIIVLDACRDNPFSFTRSKSRGLAILQTSIQNSYIVFSTSAGSVAEDGIGKNSLFTESLNQFIQTPGLAFDEVMNGVTREMKNKTDMRQVPWRSNNLDENYYLIPKTVEITNLSPKPQIQPEQAEQTKAVITQEVIDNKPQEPAISAKLQTVGENEEKKKEDMVASNSKTVMDDHAALPSKSAFDAPEVKSKPHKSNLPPFVPTPAKDFMVFMGSKTGLLDDYGEGNTTGYLRIQYNLKSNLVLSITPSYFISADVSSEYIPYDVSANLIYAFGNKYNKWLSLEFGRFDKPACYMESVNHGNYESDGMHYLVPGWNDDSPFQRNTQINSLDYQLQYGIGFKKHKFSILLRSTKMEMEQKQVISKDTLQTIPVMSFKLSCAWSMCSFQYRDSYFPYVSNIMSDTPLVFQNRSSYLVSMKIENVSDLSVNGFWSLKTNASYAISKNVHFSAGFTKLIDRNKIDISYTDFQQSNSSKTVYYIGQHDNEHDYYPYWMKYGCQYDTKIGIRSDLFFYHSSRAGFFLTGNVDNYANAALNRKDGSIPAHDLLYQTFALSYTKRIGKDSNYMFQLGVRPYGDPFTMFPFLMFRVETRFF